MDTSRQPTVLEHHQPNQVVGYINPDGVIRDTIQYTTDGGIASHLGDNSGIGYSAGVWSISNVESYKRTTIEGLKYIKTVPVMRDIISINGEPLLILSNNYCVIIDSILFRIITPGEMYKYAEMFYGYTPISSGDNRPHFKTGDYISLANFLDYIIGILINAGYKVEAPFM